MAKMNDIYSQNGLPDVLAGMPNIPVHRLLANGSATGNAREGAA